MVYLISLLPTEINDNILLILDTFDLAVVHKRFWVASKLFDIEIIKSDANHLHISHPKVSECDLMNIINYFSIDTISNVFKYACKMGYSMIVKKLLADPRVDPSTADNFAICRASYHGKEDVKQLLLADPRVDPSADDN